MAYVKSDMQNKIIKKENIEAITLVTKEDQKTGIYRPFKVTNQANYLETLIDFISSNEDPQKNIYVIGDVNFDFEKMNDRTYQQ